MGTVIEPLRDARVECDLAHEDEERDDRQSVRGEGIEKIVRHKAHGGLHIDQVRKSRHADNAHSERKLDAGHKKSQQHQKENHSYRGLTHGPPPGWS